MDSRHEVGINFDPKELDRIVKEAGGDESSEGANVPNEKKRFYEDPPAQIHENLGERILIGDQNAAMVEGIVEGFENKEVKPPRIKSERIDIPPDTAVEYAVSLIKYRISTKLEQVRAAHDAEDIQLIAHEAEALSRVKSEIAKGDIDATIRFLNEEDVRVDNKLAMVLEKAKTLGFDPKKRINLTDSAKAKAASEVSYYLTRKNDIERSIKALGGKQFSRERSPI